MEVRRSGSHVRHTAAARDSEGPRRIAPGLSVHKFGKGVTFQGRQRKYRPCRTRFTLASGNGQQQAYARRPGRANPTYSHMATGV